MRGRRLGRLTDEISSNPFRSTIFNAVARDEIKECNESNYFDKTLTQFELNELKSLKVIQYEGDNLRLSRLGKKLLDYVESFNTK